MAINTDKTGVTVSVGELPLSVPLPMRERYQAIHDKSNGYKRTASLAERELRKHYNIYLYLWRLNLRVAGTNRVYFNLPEQMTPDRCKEILTEFCEKEFHKEFENLKFFASNYPETDETPSSTAYYFEFNWAV